MQLNMKIAKNIILVSLFGLLLGSVCCSGGSEEPGTNPEPGKPEPPVTETSDVELYVTTASRSKLFEKVPLRFGKAGSMSPYTVTLDPAVRYQSVDGFGLAVTGSTCCNLLKMTPGDRTAFLREIFDPTEGMGHSFIRVSIGASDFSLDEYTWCDRKGIEFFEVNAHDRNELFPILREIKAINPNIRIIGSPWSCPKWMKMSVDGKNKTFDSWTSGRLNPDYYQDYAEYFVQWIQTMEAEGFPIHAITIQNEPLNHGNSMSLYMPWEDQLAFIKTALGPAFRRAGIKTKVLVFDHNFNYDNVASQRQYPLHIYADAEAAQYVDGSAWHNYGGNVAELDAIREAAPDKSIYFTEASIGTWNYKFADCLLNDFETIFLGTLTRCGKGVTLWNLMLDDKRGPNRPGGCTTCYGAVDINSSDYKTLDRKSHYYNVSHCSKVIRPDAVRIGTTGFTASGLSYAAFENTDGTYAFVVLNKNSAAQSLTVADGTHSFKYEVPARSIASFRWKK